MEELKPNMLLAVSFGTSFAGTREKTIGAIERRLAQRFPESVVRRCFTSRMIRRKLLERDGLRIDSPEEALREALESGITELTVQPLYLMHGQEDQKVRETVEQYIGSFDKLYFGNPLLTEEEDFRIIAEAVSRHLPVSGTEKETAAVLMGHGSPSGRGNEAYAVLQEALKKAGAAHHYVATVEGEPQIGDILPVIRAGGYKKVILAPLMIVAGDHALHDLAGEDDDSWKNLFLRSGFAVETVLRGIGEWEEVQDLFAEHAAAARILRPQE